MLVLAPILYGAIEPASAGDRTEQIYEGAVGNLPIVLSLDAADGSVSGKYFYKSKRFDILLEGEAHGRSLQLESRWTGDKFKLSPSTDGYAGSLTTEKGKSFPVELHKAQPVIPGNLPADLPDGLDDYEKARLAGLALSAQKIEKLGDRSLEWYVEPLSQISLFRLEGGYPAPTVAAINKSLAQIQWRNVSNYFSCADSSGGPGAQSSFRERPYLSDAFVSFAISESWDCAGAAHPDFGVEGHSFETKTGHEISLDELLHFGKAQAPKENTDPWYEYRGKTFAPGIVALLKRLHPKQMAPHKDGCNYDQSDVWSFPAWFLTDKGLYVGASFPRYMRDCDNPDWSVVPYSALNK
jgi:hypothetical protein